MYISSFLWFICAYRVLDCIIQNGLLYRYQLYMVHPESYGKIRHYKY